MSLCPNCAAELTKIEAERDRLRECLVDIAEGWVGNVQEKARKVLR